MTTTLLSKLEVLGLSSIEVKVFFTLQEKTFTLLELGRKTKLNRTTLYRVVRSLENKGLVRQSVDRWGKTVSGEPIENLEVLVSDQEERAEGMRKNLKEALAMIAASNKQHRQEIIALEVRRYEGIQGFKQMLFHEFSTREELRVFTHAPLEMLVGRYHAERHRAKLASKKIKAREILTDGSIQEKAYSNHKEYVKLLFHKVVARDVLPIDQEMVIYDNIVAIYDWRSGEKVGVEIRSNFFSMFFKSIFDRYWSL